MFTETILAHIINLSPKVLFLFASALTCLVVTILWIIVGVVGNWYSGAAVQTRPWEDLEKQEKSLKEFKKAARKSFGQKIVSLLMWLILSWGGIFLIGYGMYVYYLNYMT